VDEVPVARWLEQAEPAAGAPRASALEVDAQAWRNVAQDVAAGGGRLLALWGDTSLPGRASVQALYVAQPGAVAVELPVAMAAGRYPGLEDVFPAAGRLQRAVFDMHGLRSTGEDQRPWLRHAAWPEESHPLAAGGVLPAPESPAHMDCYQFVRVEGDGVHEVPVGPVHAGIIEPGHFRFSIVGEKVLRLEQRLGYVHKGIERRFQSLALRDAHRLAARVSGDSAVAFSWAYCQALEGMAGALVPPRAAWLRALALELERIANHLGDLGALGNDAGFAFGLAQFSRIKELLLRSIEQALGQRYLFDFVVPGGTCRDLDPAAAGHLATYVTALAAEARKLKEIYDEHAGVRDRFAGAGTVAPELARRLGLIGLAGRASGQDLDLRIDLPCEPYVELGPVKCGTSDGDVLARVAVRFDELQESCRLVEHIVKRLPPGPHSAPLRDPPDCSRGIGLIEGWRGPVVMALTAGEGGSIRRCHPQDPSWHNWPVLEHAVIGNIVPDFPLINKSFNLSYSGHDL
jgi:Ni,Fe-hydrogenase III large subunit/Ni,Fe-hydrogenase III component G